MSSVTTKFIRVNKSQSYVFKKSVNYSVSIIFFSSCSRTFLLNYNKMYKMQAHSAFFAVEGSDLSAKYVDKQKCQLISNSNNFNVCLHSYQIKKKNYLLNIYNTSQNVEESLPYVFKYEYKKYKKSYKYQNIDLLSKK